MLLYHDVSQIPSVVDAFVIKWNQVLMAVRLLCHHLSH